MIIKQSEIDAAFREAFNYFVPDKAKLEQKNQIEAVNRALEKVKKK